MDMPVSFSENETWHLPRTENKDWRPRKEETMHYIWEMKTNGTAYLNLATIKRSGGIAIFHLTDAASLITEKQKLERIPAHRTLTITGKIHNRLAILRSVYTPVKQDLKAQFNTSFSRQLGDIHIFGGDMNCTLDKSLNSRSFTA